MPHTPHCTPLMGLNIFDNMLMCSQVKIIFSARTPKQPCKLAWNFDLPKTIFHGMTLFGLWYPDFCHAMENSLNPIILSESRIKRMIRNATDAMVCNACNRLGGSATSTCGDLQRSAIGRLASLSTVAILCGVVYKLRRAGK